MGIGLNPFSKRETGVKMIPKQNWLKAGLAAATLAGVFAFTSAPVVHADDEGCKRRIVKADHRLHEAAEHHGWDSREAAEAREQLAAARHYCWEHEHKWWDEDGHAWHRERDWDDHDHDHPPHPPN
jgi:hypothetical protein